MRVVVLSDQAIPQAGLVALLGAQAAIADVVGTDDLVAADTAARERGAHVVVVSCGVGSDTVAAVAGLTHRACPVPALVLAAEGTAAFVRRAFAEGAGGVLPMSATVVELVDALRCVAARTPYVHPRLGALLAQTDPARILDTLSPREREVLRLIALGYTNPQIAAALVVSVRTVETHRAHLAAKLEASTRAQLVRIALENGLLSGG